MDIAWTILFVSVVAVGVGVWQKIVSVPPLPKLERSWWGVGEPTKVDESIRPFKIHFSDEVRFLHGLNLSVQRFFLNNFSNIGEPMA